MQKLTRRIDLGRDANIIIASLGIFSLAQGFNSVAQPIYLAMLGISPTLIGLTVSVSLFMSIIGFVILGILADKVGRRPILFAQYASSVIFNLIYFFAKDYALFLLAAIIGGLGNGAPSSMEGHPLRAKHRETG